MNLFSPQKQFVAFNLTPETGRLANTDTSIFVSGVVAPYT